MKTLFAFLSFALVAEALAKSGGTYGVRSLIYIGCAMLLMLYTLLRNPKTLIPNSVQVALVVVWILRHLWMHNFRTVDVYFPTDLVRSTHFDIALLICAVLLIFPISFSKRFWKAGFFGVISIFITMAVIVLLHSKNPFIDVYAFQQHGANQLLNGVVPYGGEVKNMYGNLDYYSPEVANLTTVFIGFPYFPVSLISVVPSQYFFGDVRYTHLFFAVGSALLFFAINPTRLGSVLALAFLFQSRMFHFLVFSWVDLAGVFFLSLAIFLESRSKERASAFAAGLFFCAKQTNLLVCPFLLANVPRARRLTWTLSVLALAGLVTLPFLIAAPQGFFRDVVVCQLHQPVRDDALSFFTMVWREGGVRLHPVLPFVLSIASFLLLLKKSVRENPVQNTLACGFAFLVFYAFNKQAFCNYYIFTTGVLMLGALRSAREEQTTRDVILKDEVPHGV